MVEDLLFVSCDIIGHSVDPDMSAQLGRARAINEIVRHSLESAEREQALWLSGGDGGHVALSGAAAPARALELLIALRTWAIESRVALRVTGCSGTVQRFPGADGQPDVVGPGVNLAARMLQHAGSDDRVVVSEGFHARCQAEVGESAWFHDPRTLSDPFSPPQQAYLFSVRGRFRSRWGARAETAEQDDRSELLHASARKDGLAVLYRAKRLLQINGGDGDAIAALREYMGSEAGRIGTSKILRQLFADVSLGQEFVRVAVLIERAEGDLLCRAGDDGRTMFLILGGRLTGCLPSAEVGGAMPDFEVGPGELVGEMAFALNASRTATLRCADRCSLLAFSQQELIAAANTSPLLPRIKQVVDSIVLARILQNTCRTARYLSGPARSGPLGACDKPWLDLGPYSRTISLNWQKREVRFDEPAFREPGLYILAGGKLATREGSIVQPAAPDPPIMVAELPTEIQYRSAPCRLLDDVTILFISSVGLDQFGPAVYDGLAAEIRARTDGERRSGNREGSAIRGTAVEGLLKIGGNDQADRAVDVVFVHGLDGDARSTWHPKDNPALFWPAWLTEDVTGATVWSLGYEVSSSAWRGTTMPLADRATNALATLETQGLGDRPIVFICHSLGGLLVKQMLRHSLDFGVASWKAIAGQTRGIVFLSTPHSGSDISGWMKHLGSLLRLTVSVEELQAHDPRLRELNTWFRNCTLTGGMRIQVYCEKQTVSGLLVVNESSADPGLQGVIPIPVDENHISICKPESRDKLIYSRIRRFVADSVDARP